MAPDLLDIFNAFGDYLDKEQEKKEEVRKIVKEIQQAGNKIALTLLQIHDGCSSPQIQLLCKTSREIIETTVKPGYQKLDALIKPKITNEYYRFHDLWRYATQKMAFHAALIVYLESGKLVEWHKAADILGITTDREKGFHLDLEDFLMGLLNLGPEMSRFAKTSVTKNDLKRPFDIHRFIKDLFNGFLNLNLKNDALRKKFDSLKYDVNRVEDVIYDLTKPQKTLEEVLKSKEPQSSEGFRSSHSSGEGFNITLPKQDDVASKIKDSLAANWKKDPSSDK